MDIRDLIIENLVNEIIGPNPNPHYLDPDTNEERLLKYVHGSPKQKYGAGILYPRAIPFMGISNTSDEDGIQENPIEVDITGHKISEFEINNLDSENNEEEPVSLANQYAPSAMGFTVRINNQCEDLKLSVKINCASYILANTTTAIKKIDKDTQSVVDYINKDGNVVTSEYWTRVPYIIEPINLDLSDLIKMSNGVIYNQIIQESIQFQIFNRTTTNDREKNISTLTFVIINSKTSGSEDTKDLLFQSELIIESNVENLILPYKERESFNDTTEEKEFNLLYRDNPVFAIGHGTSVVWENTFSHNTNWASKIKTSSIPIYDIPQIAPTSHIELSMFELSDLGNWNSSLQKLDNLATQYSAWVESLSSYLNDGSLSHYTDAIENSIINCNNISTRINNGVNILRNNPIDSQIVKCFRWMNRAMIWQQQRSKAKIVNWSNGGIQNETNYTLENEIHFESLEEFSKNGKGRWRPFQLAFILMNLESITNPNCEERKIVDLIWFPTGGGKTEAYLGLAAFNIFYRRIAGELTWNWNNLGGTSIIMRYTLRLLSTQQYERAASLICACDLIRKENPTVLGDERIDIGLWVGGETTPNDNDKARSLFKALSNRRNTTPYTFVVMKCPCCGAKIGSIAPGILKGVKCNAGNTSPVYFQCDNNNCEYFATPLPLEVVDEYIYENPPTLLLATVDKFAMIPWKENAGKLFGFRFNDNESCNYRIKPPELIIQDELHLISGPLGTMVGLYETMVQTLCNNYNSNTVPFLNDTANFIAPKIVASSATISRAFEQVQALYGIKNRSQLNIFPPQGVKFGNTWFSEEKPVFETETSLSFPRRRYVGVMASGFPSSQTAIVRAYASVLQTLAENKEVSNVDYYWTLVGYYNSIRELGGARSLLAGDIVERLGQLQNMNLITKDKKRYLNRIIELTSQISSSQIPEYLKQLETNFNVQSNKAADVCLATNMLATGVDISRLGLIFIHGQPKTSAEYIQASSRVGRDLPNGPGLVFTIYSSVKPRDKSQYEQFQGYHSRIYANVEPTSVTPFSINARTKALHAIAIGLLRHFSTDNLRYTPLPSNEANFIQLSELIIKIIQQRVEIVDSNELNNTKNNLIEIFNYPSKGFLIYGDAMNSGARNGNKPLFYSNSAEVPDSILLNKQSVSTPTSMRGVDSESHLKISNNV